MTFSAALPSRLLACLGCVVLLAPCLAGGEDRSGRAVGEHLIVVGGPALWKWEGSRAPADRHDRVWYNFVRKAKFRAEELMVRHGREIQITLLVYRPAYVSRQSEEGRPLVRWVESIRDDYFQGRHGYEIDLVWFDSASELIGYVNDRPRRRRLKVRGFEYFGHSNRHAFMFDYSNAVPGASREWLHEDELHRFNRRAFAENALCRSFGCHTGESMSGRWREATGLRMWGVVGKTDYAASNTEAMITPGGYWAY